jgi:hypothetical protein
MLETTTRHTVTRNLHLNAHRVTVSLVVNGLRPRFLSRRRNLFGSGPISSTENIEVQKCDESRLHLYTIPVSMPLQPQARPPSVLLGALPSIKLAHTNKISVLVGCGVLPHARCRKVMKVISCF